jgi:hypothetical protein
MVRVNVRRPNQSLYIDIEVKPGDKKLSWRWLDGDDIVEGGFLDNRLYSVYLDYLPAAFSPDDDRIIIEWNDRGLRAEKSGPFVYHGENFSLMGLIEYIYKENRRLYG